MWLPDTLTSTPCGIAIGLRPILLTSASPHETENFAAGPVLLRLLIRYEAFRGRDDRDAESSEDARQRVAFRVHAKTGLRDPLDPGDRLLPVRPVLERHRQDGPFLPARDGEFLDVSLALQDVGDRNLLLRRRHNDLVLPGRRAVADAGKHVCDRIGHRHLGITSSTS